MKYTLKQILAESTAAEQAKKLGLVYGGFASWLNPTTRTVMAKTINGTLVRVDDDDNDANKNRGMVAIIPLDDQAINLETNAESKEQEQYVALINSILKKGGKFCIVCSANFKRTVVQFMRKYNIKTGGSIVEVETISPTTVVDVVKEKIEEKYTTIQYFDTSDMNVEAVKSLRATYNRVQNLQIIARVLKPRKEDTGEKPSE